MAAKRGVGREVPRELEYTGPDPATVGCVPLPEGWPARNHIENDLAVATEKVASGFYRPLPLNAAPGEECC